MKVLLISDVHANLQALEAVLNRTNYDDVLFIGDAVDYGPNPNEVLGILQYANAERVLGNHDAAAAFGIDCRSSKAFYEASLVTRKRITLNLMPRKSLDILGKAEKKLNLSYDGLRVRALHAAPGDELYRYMSKEEAFGVNMSGTDLLVVGHTHIPYEVKNNNGVWVVNPGSVGMPKDGDPRASYVVLDTNKRQVSFERAPYDIDLMLSELQKLIGDDKPVFELLSQTFSRGR